MDYKDLKVLFEDNHIIVVYKPANIPTQSDISGDKDMCTIVKEYLINKYDKQGDAYLGMIQRLDRPTAGLLMFAKTSKAAKRLNEQFKEHQITKKYFAIVRGKPPIKEDKLVCYLKKYEKQNIVKVVPQLTEGSKYAELSYKLITSNDKTSLLLIDLVTGRSHQIRVQLSSNFMPIIGDNKYGDNTNVQLALFACELKFMHPISGEKHTFRLYPPEEEPWLEYKTYTDSVLEVLIKNS